MENGVAEKFGMKLRFCLVSFSVSWVVIGAFFSSNTSDSRRASQLFPSTFPDSIFTPWVWDVHYDRTDDVVEVVIVSRSACFFNHTKWKLVVDKFPAYSKYLGYGLDSSIIVNPQEALFRLSEALFCHFYRGGLPVAKSKSEIIRGKRVFLTIGSILVVCPSPIVEYDSMRLERDLTTSKMGPFTDSLFNVLNTSLSSSFTDAFPVSNIPEFKVDVGIAAKQMDPHVRSGLSICTATSRSDRAYLVEWVEHHLYLGVSHIYIYSTAKSQRNHEKLLEALSDYIQEGIVVVVPWMYENCVRGMGSGRYVIYTDPAEGLTAFRPPRAIAHSAALASCYSRFRKTSRYMMHIDDDEFVALGRKVMSTLKGQEMRGPLVRFVSRMFHDNPKATSIVIEPMQKHLCPGMGPKDQLGGNANQSSHRLPRVGTWQFTVPGHSAEGKLIMKTKAVRMFFVHYVSQTEDGSKDYESKAAHRSQAVLLHYKEPREVSGEPYGMSDLSSVQQGNLSVECRAMRNRGGLYEGRKNGFYHETIKEIPEGFNGLKKLYMVQGIDANTKDVLREWFTARMWNGSHPLPYLITT